MSARGLSAGLLLYRRKGNLEVLLGHPGGPFFRHKDAGAWTIPKGAPLAGEPLEAAARREFAEEIGCAPPGARLEPLGDIRQKGGKVVHAFALEGDLPAGFVVASNMVEMEWPPRSGRHLRFPEIDRAEFFPISVAREKINAAQVALLDRLVERLGATGSAAEHEPGDDDRDLHD